MKKYLFPDVYVESILDLPLEKLYAHGIRAFILDLDNTVTEWNSQEVKSEVVAWMKEVKNKGFKACIASNNGRERVVAVAEGLGIPFVSKAGKPRRKAFCRALKVMDSSPEETAVVGDQIFTDILGGNRMNLFTILVVPINKREFIGTRVMRKFEIMVLRKIKEAIKQGDVNSLLSD
ncbi:MAG: YqeG family HAD IIIA-type phosphatase [Bacillota bacterium]